jgi:hypothetical protein
MPRKSYEVPVAVSDAKLALNVAKIVLSSLDSAVDALQGFNNVTGVEVTPGLSGPTSATLRVTMNHARGERVHFYTVKVAEMTT